MICEVCAIVAFFPVSLVRLKRPESCQKGINRFGLDRARSASLFLRWDAIESFGSLFRSAHESESSSAASQA